MVETAVVENNTLEKTPEVKKDAGQAEVRADAGQTVVVVEDLLDAQKKDPNDSPLRLSHDEFKNLGAEEPDIPAELDLEAMDSNSPGKIEVEQPSSEIKPEYVEVIRPDVRVHLGDLDPIGIGDIDFKQVEVDGQQFLDLTFSSKVKDGFDVVIPATFQEKLNKKDGRIELQLGSGEKAIILNIPDTAGIKAVVNSRGKIDEKNPENNAPLKLELQIGYKEGGKTHKHSLSFELPPHVALYEEASCSYRYESYKRNWRLAKTNLVRDSKGPISFPVTNLEAAVREKVAPLTDISELKQFSHIASLDDMEQVATAG